MSSFKMENLLWAVILTFHLQKIAAENRSNIQPEFTEPVKNITIGPGSNVEFSCFVKHLGSYRMMWLKNDGKRESLVSINLLKITKNPRISVSMISVSDEITQSTIYIRNIVDEDVALYECAVNTSPLISQTGTLEFQVNQLKPIKHEDGSEGLTKLSPNHNDAYITHQIPNDTPIAKEFVENIVTSTGSSTESIDCSEIKSYWDEATDNIKEMLKAVFTSLVNFTCSFFTPNQ